MVSDKNIFTVSDRYNLQKTQNGKLTREVEVFAILESGIAHGWIVESGANDTIYLKKSTMHGSARTESNLITINLNSYNDIAFKKDTRTIKNAYNQVLRYYTPDAETLNTYYFSENGIATKRDAVPEIPADLKNDRIMNNNSAAEVEKITWPENEDPLDYQNRLFSKINWKIADKYRSMIMKNYAEAIIILHKSKPAVYSDINHNVAEALANYVFNNTEKLCSDNDVYKIKQLKTEFYEDISSSVSSATKSRMENVLALYDNVNSTNVEFGR